MQDLQVLTVKLALIPHMSHISVFPLVSSSFWRKTQIQQVEDIIFIISLSPVLLLPWIQLQIGGTQLASWECSCFGSELCVLCLEMVDYCQLTRPYWNQPLDISKKWVILYSNTAPAQIQAPEGRGSKNCPWKVIAHWMKNKIVLITLRIYFASLEMVIFAVSKVDCKYQVSEKLSVADDNS